MDQWETYILPMFTTPTLAKYLPVRKRAALLAVHGMGDQKERDMLSEIGNSLSSWVVNWVEGHGGKVKILPGNLTREDKCETCNRSGGPLHVHAIWHLPRGRSPRDTDVFDVIIAESWWADLVRPPASSKLSDWLPSLAWNVAWRGLFWSGIFLAAGVFSFAVVGGGAWTDAIVPAALMVAAVFVLGLLVPPALLVLGKIPPLSKHAKGALNFLVLWVGDVFVYQQNPIDTAAARDRIKDDIRWLRDDRRDVVVAAHSLGSLLAVDALKVAGRSGASALVTFGSAIKLLKLRAEQYVSQLDRACPGLMWVNLYDPLDFISGPVKYRDSFPYNLKADNCRSILRAHGAYPDNGEQFLMTLFRILTGPGRPHGRDLELAEAIQGRGNRSLFRSITLMATAPALMGITLLLFKVKWPRHLSDAIKGTSLSQPVKDYFETAIPHVDSGKLTSGLGVCLGASLVIIVVLNWVTRLYLAWWERRAAEALTRRDRSIPPQYLGVVLLLILAAAIVLPPFLVVDASADTPAIGLIRGFGYEFFPLIASALAFSWVLWIRYRRELRTPAVNGRQHPDPGVYLGEALKS
ncbi:hypothetical protein AHiyo6_10210 [Arthrobacter sp. Hiyo6]|nr:hypothetical protein AHiyo6_10210 [Arthrobacter sp. Hiyo6]